MDATYVGSCRDTPARSRPYSLVVSLPSFSAFSSLYRFVSRQFSEEPPRIVLAVLTYLEGLGYAVVCSGDVASRYASEGVARGPARHWMQVESERSTPTPPPTTSTPSGPSYWYAMDMVRGGATKEATADAPGGTVDQMLVHVRVTAAVAFVHCSRSVWRERAGGPYVQVDVGASGYEAHTSCTLDGDDMIEMQLAAYDDGETLRQDGLGGLLRVLGAFFCTGSARVGEQQREERGGRGERGERGEQEGGHVETGPTTGITGAPYGDRDDADRLRVGQSDLDPFDRRGAGRGLGGPDGMMVGPHHPMFGRGRLEPGPGHEGHLPPGGRWDPIAPPGMPGFFPGDFERGRGRGRGRGGGDGDGVHPDIMPLGRGGGPPPFL